jgi:hypothetical protein
MSILTILQQSPNIPQDEDDDGGVVTVSGSVNDVRR